MSNDSHTKLGWWLFVVSAVFFIWAAQRSGDVVAIVGALSFLLANLSFMIPLYRREARPRHR